MAGTLHGDLYTFVTISRRILLRMRNVSDKIGRENQNIHLIFNNFFFFENRAVYEIMWKNIVGIDRLQLSMSTWRMRIACCITEVTHTHTHSMRNNYCLSTATTVVRRLLYVTFISTLPVLIY
jgi:hypothetical protein